jgi:hypothetical protein
MGKHSILLRAAKYELSCERCVNNGYVTDSHGEKDECPRCHGHKKNVAIIELLEHLVAAVDGPSHPPHEDKS